MTNLDIAQQRLYNQYISTQIFTTPSQIVKHMGAMQAQDYAGAKWAIGLRLQKSSDAAIDKAMDRGDIIRTHVLRPTWHFIGPADARWMIELSAPRINAAAASRYRQLQLDNAVFKKSNDLLAKNLAGGKQLDRAGVMAALNNGGIKTDDLRFIHLLMHAELDQVICSGGRQGKQFTYALFDDRVPPAAPFSKEQALAELAKRYFTSRGPATLADFAWWGGLTLTDAKTGLEIVKHELTETESDGKKFWMPNGLPDIPGGSPMAHLLPAFDEFAVAYADRTATVNAKYREQARYVIFDPSIVVNGQVAGTWKRVIKSNSAEISLNPFGKLSKADQRAVDNAVTKYQKFIAG